MPLSRAPKCPTCGTKSGVRKIIYGMPDSMPDESKYAIGGCCIALDGTDPLWTCTTCDEQWGFAMPETVIDTPQGKMSWHGELNEHTAITLPNGRVVSFYSIISMTNGACFEWFHTGLKEDNR